MRAPIVLAVAVLGLCAGPVLAQTPELEAQVDGQNDELNYVVTDQKFGNQGPVWWSDRFNRIGTNYSRLHMRVLGKPANADTTVIIQGDDGERYSYTIDEIGAQGLWTELMPMGGAAVSIESAERPAGLILDIDQISFQADAGAPYSQWGGVDETKQMNDPAVSDQIRGWGKPIAKLVFQNGGVPRACTGFLIGESTLVTNQHCINNDESCRSLVALFGYEFDQSNQLKFGKQYRCVKFDPAKSNFDLDVTIVELKGKPGADYGFVKPAEPATRVQGPLVVIQHPGGNPKQVSFINCAVAADEVEGRAPKVDFTHTCDTAGGSSGSPVFDQNGRLVGLHHYGFNESDVWSENRAVRFRNIYSWLQNP